MKMEDWINKLDSFLAVSDKKILTNSGKVSHNKAVEKAKIEYDKFRKDEDKKYLSDFDKEMKRLIGKEDK